MAFYNEIDPKTVEGHRTRQRRLRSDGSKANYFKTYWRTHQMSDPLPMWLELRINYTQQYLMRKVQTPVEG
jgi:hypothetical protein